MGIRLTEHDVLLVVDVQNDFCPGGRLPVPHGDEVVPIINRIARRFAHVVLTQDGTRRAIRPLRRAILASSHSRRSRSLTGPKCCGLTIASSALPARRSGQTSRFRTRS